MISNYYTHLILEFHHVLILCYYSFKILQHHNITMSSLLFVTLYTGSSTNDMDASKACVYLFYERRNHRIKLTDLFRPQKKCSCRDMAPMWAISATFCGSNVLLISSSLAPPCNIKALTARWSYGDGWWVPLRTAGPT